MFIMRMEKKLLKLKSLHSTETFFILESPNLLNLIHNKNSPFTTFASLKHKYHEYS